jgi:hypothetical protein
MEPGQRWAYRAKSTEPVICVEIRQIGTSRPARVKIRFVDDVFEGRQEWVPPARLKVLWDRVAAWQAREDRWRAVREESLGVRGTDREWAADLVVEAVAEPHVVSLGYNRDTGLLFCRDLEALRDRYGVDTDVITTDPLTFVDDGTYIAPWRATERVCRDIARQGGDRVLAQVAKEERKNQQEAIYGCPSSTKGGSPIDPQWCQEWAEERRRVHDIARAWVGVAAVERYEELMALRREVARLGDLLEHLISEVRGLGHPAVATRYERELGVPASLIHAARSTRSLPDCRLDW